MKNDCAPTVELPIAATRRQATRSRALLDTGAMRRRANDLNARAAHLLLRVRMRGFAGADAAYRLSPTDTPDHAT